MALPGVRDDGIEVRPGPTPGTLSIRARAGAGSVQGRPLLLERAPMPAAQERVLPVAWDADVAAAKTTLDAGILTVLVPKKQASP